MLRRFGADPVRYYAHTAEDCDGKPLPQTHWQPLAEHLRNVATLAKQFAAPMGLAPEAELAGLLHDLGKYADRFQTRLRNPAAIHGINHWTAGARMAADLKALLDYVIEGHHTGLPSFADLQQALLKINDPSSARELTGCAESVQELFKRFEADGLRLQAAPSRPARDSFANSLRTRMLFSCLVDADFLDTESHFDPEAAKQRTQFPLQAGDALGLLLAHLDMLQSNSTETPISRIRRQLLADCLKAADKSPGLFTLTAPTGSGKTLASLAFALKHIEHHNASLPPEDPRRFRRIIVVIPFTSIIEQTARVYREVFEPAFGPDYILEHHSAVGPREDLQGLDLDAEDGRMRRARLAAENWACPLVVTTTVQFFESLFANKPADCRKLHNIARSVLLFDEVQTLPPTLLPSLLSAVRLLSQEPYGVTAVFMTATQPAFGSARSALPYGWDPVEISSAPSAMAETMRRTSIRLPGPAEKCSWHEIASRMVEHPQALCVVNTTKDARELFRLLPRENRFHLSARLCPAHRQEKLRIIRDILIKGGPCRLVSTQLIEAGVDLDFPVAFRAIGPLDSIIQTAGRCNREGRFAEPQPVIVFRPETGGLPPGAYRIAAAKTEEFLARHQEAPLHQPETYAKYFMELYGLLGRDSPQADPVFCASERFDFPRAASECRLIGEDTYSVLVKWRQGEELVAKLRREKHLLPEEWRRVQRFSINLHLGEFLDAQVKGYIVEAIEDVWVWNSQYDEDLGACHAGLNDYCQ
ncbi:MAG: CRISPR-associated helicase Cas3' [Verrucomicrobia bacterium]|nr:CRISPR-associated helicase Cas3' [Verrucomicrobiota bacterium]